ncbi:MAG: ammonium transporter [Ignavibacteria bacterium]|jgi:Amt family ammonium transporter|nr:ammonium transporter [Ignavibacteria bacterium]
MFNSGSTGFMLVCTSLVMLMTPALAFFYGGLASKRNILGIMVQSFVSMGWSTLLWFLVGYSLCFSGSLATGSDFLGIIGNFDKAMLMGVTPESMFAGNNEIPEFVFIAFQMMFAIITPALITGAFVNRVTFKGYMIFLTVWQFLVYYPFCHMVWGGGLLADWGVLDFAGGIVVHATAGFAALASVFFVGERVDKDSTPNSIPLVAIGTGLLWFGWYGFNAGSELRVDGVTANAFLNTDVAASFALVTWLVIEWIRKRQPKFVGILTGSIAGLATITPCAGFVPLWAAPIIGICAGAGCYLAVELKNKKKWDDALDVWGVHGIGGVIGTILLGVFASKHVNPGGADGLWFGDSTFFFKEVISVAVAAAYAFIFTYFMLWVINKITPVRVSEKQELAGLDSAIHGEIAYDEGVL